MAKKKIATVKIITPTFRIAFHSLLRPHKFDNEKDEKYKIGMLFPKGTDLSDLKKKTLKYAKAAFGTKPTKEQLKYTWTKIDEDNKYGEEFTGCIFIKAKSFTKLALLDEDREEVIDPGEIYKGRQARAVMHPFYYEDPSPGGISFDLDAVQLLDHDERIGGEGGYSVDEAKADFSDDDNDDDFDLDDDDEDVV
jgi:hypothetical protein